MFIFLLLKFDKKSIYKYVRKTQNIKNVEFAKQKLYYDFLGVKTPD